MRVLRERAPIGVADAEVPAGVPPSLNAGRAKEGATPAGQAGLGDNTGDVVLVELVGKIGGKLKKGASSICKTELHLLGLRPVASGRFRAHLSWWMREGRVENLQTGGLGRTQSG